MNRYIILYDLRKKNKDNYPKLYEWFDANKTVMINESSYLIFTDKPLKTVYSELDSLTNKDDDLVINEFPRKAIAKNSNKANWFKK